MRWLVLLAFFGSGLSSLVLENLWVRQLTLVFGGTTLAITTVLSVFMGGLALGSHLAGRWIHRFTRPLRVYGLLEASIATYAFFLPQLISYLPGIYQWIPEDWPFVAIALFRFLLCSILLVFPTTLMGATLPILSQYFVRDNTTLGMDVGILYSVNTYGAVAGALTGGFVLMPLLGTSTTLWLVCIGLFAMATAVFVYDFRNPNANEETHLAWRDAQEQKEPEVIEFEDSFLQAEEEEPIAWGMATRESLFHAMNDEQHRKFQSAIAGTLVVTGASAMVCQIIWSRTLSMVIGSSTYSFTLILSLFLIGLASGAAYASRLIHKSLNLLETWTRLLILTAIALGFGSFFFDSLPLLFIRIALNLPETIPPLLLFSLKAGIAAIPILLPTFLMGTFFPLALSLLTHSDRAVGESVGRLYMLNTIGAIVGSAMAGFVIIPTLGLQRGIALSGASYLLCAAMLKWRSFQPTRRSYAIFAGVGLLTLFFLPTWSPSLMSIGSFRLSVVRSYTYEQLLNRSPVLFYKEGITATVSVEGSSYHRTLKINGKPEASTEGDRPTQISIAAFPLALHPNPKDAALIGWGSGMTAGAALFFPLRQLIAVELEPVVIEAARLMEPWNYKPHQHKNLKLRYNDGRNFLATTQQSFDVIISEPSNPWISGVSNLFTREYFQLARQRLRPKGVFCQWVQLYEISSRNVASILRSIHAEFPYVRLFEVSANDTDTFLVATTYPWELNLANLQNVISDPRYRQLFQDANIVSAYDFLPRFLMGEQEIPKMLKKVPSPANTDAHNLLEYTAPLDLVNASAATEDAPFTKTVASLGRPFLKYVKRPKEMTPEMQALFWQNVSMAYLRYGKVKEARKYLTKATRLSKKLPDLDLQERWFSLMQGKENEPNLPSQSDVRKHLKKHGDKLRKFIKLFLEGHTYYEKKKFRKCRIQFDGLLENKELAPLFPQVWYYHGECARQTWKYFDAWKSFSIYSQRVPQPQGG